MNKYKYMNINHLMIVAAMGLFAACNGFVNDGSEKQDSNEIEQNRVLSKDGAEVYLITESSASFSEDEEMAEIITKEATLRMESSNDGKGHINIMYSWANTGWELDFEVPCSFENGFNLDNQSVEGFSCLWYDNVRNKEVYSGEFTVSAYTSPENSFSITVSGRMSGPFKLVINGIEPVSGPVEKEDSFVIIDQALGGWDVFRNLLDKDIKLTMTEFRTGDVFSFNIAPGGVIEKAAYIDDGENVYNGIDLMESIIVECDGKAESFKFGDAPFSHDTRLSEKTLKPVLMNGILGIMIYTTNTYIISFLPKE